MMASTRPAQGGFERLLGIAVSERAAGGDDTVNQLRHWIALRTGWDNPEWFAASASGQMIQAGIKNKYGFDIQVSAADMAGQVIKRP